ncbi:hypothetical protein LTR37_018991 [Vermiconidia calcicola]|uniref:Uncharacterized protein n=1 Tax=Vermiconidia calcicola TaxID=1690605 RepID=A0ACC3MGK7_9PEZI|nr:hypothetical protein LTR37_018991 [Vermiconidia calcicola]
MPSFLGYKADDFLVSGKGMLEQISAELAKDGCHTLASSVAAGASSGVLDTLTPTLKIAQNWAMFGAAASGIVPLTSTLVGAQAVRQFQKLAMEMSKSLKGLCEAAEVRTNLEHEAEFPKLVYEMVADKIATAAGPNDLDAINDESLANRFRLLQSPVQSPAVRVASPAPEKKKLAHYFFVYHPGTAWHSIFNNMVRSNPLPGFIGATNNLSALGLYLQEFRAVIGPEAVIHILLPSAHMYVIEEDIIVAKEVQPLRVVGQKHYTGDPGLEESCIQDVGLLIKPNKVGAGQMTGAVAGGLGASIVGTIVGFGAVGVIAATGCAFAGPVFLAGAAADLIIGGGMIAGALGGGSTAGALTGIAMTENFKWKGTGRDEKAKKSRG